MCIMVLQKRSICLSLRDSKIEGVPSKILGRSTLTSVREFKTDRGQIVVAGNTSPQVVTVH